MPQWDLDRLEKRCCILCSCENQAPVCFRPDGLVVAKCSQCGSLFLPLVPGDEDLQRYYDRYSEHKGYIQEKLKVSPPSWGRKAAIASAGALKKMLGNRFASRVKSRSQYGVSDICEMLIRTGGVEGKTILEVGAGRFGGILPELGRWGGRGVAIEVDGSALKAINALGIEVYPDISQAPSDFDIVYAGMVLEHVKAPFKMLEELHQKAKPGGRIVLTVPNGGQAAFVGANWIGFRVDLEHLNYFCSSALCNLLAKAGFEPECIWTSSQPILPQYFEMADRNNFIEFARRRYSRRIVPMRDFLFQDGDFMLTVLGRKES